jgi:hypothetical protein
MKNITREADFKARRTHLFSLVMAALTLTTVLTHILDRARVMAGGAASPAVTITVMNTNDNGAGSLRDAIGAASSGDTIEFDATVFSLPQTITLTTGALVVAQNVTIQGPGANLLSVSGNNVSGVFDIPSGFSVTISGMTIRDAGDVIQGGGIMNVGSAMINDCVIRNNTAKQGSGVQNDGTMTINNSAIINNQCSLLRGGGIVTYGLLTVKNSVVAYNNSPEAAGGIWVVGSGALTITNSTVSGNGAPTIGGGILFDNTRQPNTVVNCTITNNGADLGGGIYVSGAIVTLKNSIIASNVLGGNCAGPTPIIAAGVNFSTDGTCAGFTQVTQQELNLGPLQDNGGPTLTHALLAGSVAIDAVTDCTDSAGNPVTTDQRGNHRPEDGNADDVESCDAGAFEAPRLAQAICPQPQGYWKNNPSVWPVSSLILGDETYGKAELLAILNTPTGTGKTADASLILAYQLIAAKLNVANGSDRTPISATISAADAVLATLSGKLPYQVKSSSAMGQQMTTLAALLEQYNKTALTPACTP